MQKVSISELHKNDMVLIVCEMLVTEKPVKRMVRHFAVARVSGIIIHDRAHFWLSWKTRYTDGKPYVEESNEKLVLPLNNPEPEGIYDKVTFYRLGKWDEKSEAVLFAQEG